MSQLISPKWISIAALSAAGAALVLSAWNVSRDPAPKVEREKLTALPLAQAPQATSHDATATVEESNSQLERLPGTADQAERANQAGQADQVSPLALSIKRLVVTGAIDGREPAPSSTFEANGEPVYAFVELANDAPANTTIVVKFENPRKSVGFVKLAVPPVQTRWRTWALTRRIDEPGEWEAVVSTEGGVELARQPFTVSMPAAHPGLPAAVADEPT